MIARGALLAQRGLAAMAVATGCSAAPTHVADADRGPIDPPSTETSCARLCTDEARCGASEPGCLGTCARDAKRLRPGVAARIVECRRSALATACAGTVTAFTRGDLLADPRCLAIAAAPLGGDERNRRAWAEASCDRMLRCQAANGADVRAICVASTMHPSPQDEQEAMLVVDVLDPKVIARWTHCLAAGACPAAGQSDAAAERCLVEALERAAR